VGRLAENLSAHGTECLRRGTRCQARSPRLSGARHGQYLQHFAALEAADPGERETFALAWVLGYDVCSRDVSAAEIFHRLRPEGCPSRHRDVMPLLERLGILRR